MTRSPSRRRLCRGCKALRMRWVEVLLVAAFEWNMGGDERAVLEDANLVGEYVNIEDTAACGVGDAVEIAANAHHALMGEGVVRASTPYDKGQSAKASAPAFLRRRPH